MERGHLGHWCGPSPGASSLVPTHTLILSSLFHVRMEGSVSEWKFTCASLFPAKGEEGSQGPASLLSSPSLSHLVPLLPPEQTGLSISCVPGTVLSTS